MPSVDRHSTDEVNYDLRARWWTMQCPRKEMACIISRFGGIEQKVDDDLVNLRLSFSKFMIVANFFQAKVDSLSVLKIESFYSACSSFEISLCRIYQ